MGSQRQPAANPVLKPIASASVVDWCRASCIRYDILSALEDQSKLGLVDRQRRGWLKF